MCSRGIDSIACVVEFHPELTLPVRHWPVVTDGDI